MLYSQSIEESKLWSRSKDAKRRRNKEKEKPKFKNRVPNQDGFSAPKSNYEKSSGSQVFKPSCATYGGRNTLGSV